MTTWCSMASTWRLQSTRPDQWRKAIGRWARISISARMISKQCTWRGVRKVPITYRIDGKRRSAEIPNILHMAVDPLPTAHPSGEMWANIGHPVSPDKMAFAVGAPGNTFSDHGMRWDNSGKNGLYAPIRWSNRS